MKVLDFQQKTKKWNCFAAIDTLGSFDFYTSIISLDSVSTTDIVIANQEISEFVHKQANDSKAVLNGDSFHKITKVLPLAVHEYTHFIDATSTLWGLRHLLMMKEAYEANDVLGGTEADFHKAKRFYDHIRMIRLPEYYTLRNVTSLNTEPWRYEFSAGLLFTSEGKASNRTIVFTRFLNSTGDFLVRSPISTVSLLEMSAMAQEVLMEIFLLTNTDNDFRAVEGNLYSRRLMQYLYDPDITEYSVCVHLIANSLNLTDPVTAFRIGSILAGIILNIPTGYFSTIAASCPIEDILEVPSDHQSISYFRNGLLSCDYGALFYLLCLSLPKGNYTSNQSILFLVDTAIERVGINVQVAKSEADLEANEIYQKLKNTSMNVILQLTEAGYANYKNFSHIRLNLPFEQLNLPPVLLSDSNSLTIFSNPNNQLSTFDIDSAFSQLYDYGQAWVERFAEACV